MENLLYKDVANAVRILSAEMVDEAKSGHQGAPLGLADVFSVLLCDFINNDFLQSELRNRFVLSNGHASAMLYSGLYLTGKFGISSEDLKNFRKFGSKLQGHPEFNRSLGIEITTGMLGQGIASSVGIAIALKKKKINSKVFVMCSDGDLMEGISHEALSIASKLGLDNLIFLFDDNNICIDGHSSEFACDNIKRVESYGFYVDVCDGHSFDEIKLSINKALLSGKPSFISFKTLIGKGTSKENTSEAHGRFLSKSEIQNMRKSVGFPDERFSLPWKIRTKNTSDVSNTKKNIEFGSIFTDLKNTFISNKRQLSIREFSGIILENICNKISNVIGGAADLSESTCCISMDSIAITKNNFAGNYIHYGVREHAMGAIMNGLSLEGFIPYGGTFLVLSDYMKPAIRNSCLMGLHNIFIFSHDSICVGEDGATHQPIEHIDSLRAIPGLYVFRPCCDVELTECYQIAFSSHQSSAVLLSRQKVDNCITVYNESNLSEQGMYEIYLSKQRSDKKISLIASGSEVSLCFKSIKELEKNGFDVRIISMPCIELFEKQSDEYKEYILQDQRDKIFIEAGTCQSLYKYKKDNDVIISVIEFGESGKAEELLQKFGFTVDEMVKKALEIVTNKKNSKKNRHF